MLLLDAFFRFSGVGLLLFSAILACRDLPKSSSFYLLLLTNFTLVCHYLGFTPTEFNLPEPIRMMFRFFDVFLLFFVWLFSLSLFQKDFRLNAFHLFSGFLISGFMLAERLVNFSWLTGLPSWWPEVVNSMAFLMVFHMVFVTLTGRHDDLLEKRRTSRIYLVLIIAISAVLTIILGSILMPQHQTTVNVISLWPAIIGINFWLLHIEPMAFAFDQPVDSGHRQLSSRDALLFDKLTTVMTEQQAYLENNLSVDTLASRLAVGAPRLRNFINQQLGFNNFSTYINSLRIKAIKNALQSAENDHLPILTLALNHGFNSLPPFNRAFKQQVGITPSDYRQNHRNNIIDQQ